MKASAIPRMLYHVSQRYNIARFSSVSFQIGDCLTEKKGRRAYTRFGSDYHGVLNYLGSLRCICCAPCMYAYAYMYRKRMHKAALSAFANVGNIGSYRPAGTDQRC